MAPTTTRAAAGARDPPRRGREATVTRKGVRGGAELFRRLFPGVNNKKRRGWKFEPDVEYRLVNDLRKSSGDAIDRDKLGNNSLSHRAAASREGAAAAAALPTAGHIHLYNPEELAAALAGGHAPDLSRCLTTVNTEEAAEVMVRQGYQRFTQIVHYDTLNSGLSQLPVADTSPPDGRPAVPVHELPPPAGTVRSLPKKMLAVYKTTGDESGRCMADIVVECFEEKVIDVLGERTWHPIRMWPTDASERKNLGYEDNAGLNNRVKAYCAVKCGTHSPDQLKDKSFKELVNLAVKPDGSTGTYFDLAKRLFDSQQQQDV